MKLAVSLNHRFDQPPTVLLDALAERSLTAVTLPLAALTGDSPPGDDASTSLATLLAARAFELAAIEVPVVDRAQPERLEWAPAALSEAARLGVPLVVLHAGCHAGAAARMALCERLRVLAGDAARLGITLAVDLSVGAQRDNRSMLELVAAVDHPAAGLAFDTGRYVADHPFSDGEVALQKVSPHLSYVRLRDQSGEAGRYGFPPLGGGGAVDFFRTRAILRGVAYDGPCVIDIDVPARAGGVSEAGGVSDAGRASDAGRVSEAGTAAGRPCGGTPSINQPVVALADWLADLDAGLAHLDQCGWFDPL